MHARTWRYTGEGEMIISCCPSYLACQVLRVGQVPQISSGGWNLIWGVRSNYLSINLSIYYLSIYIYIYLPIYLSIYQFIYLSIYLSIQLSTYPFLYLSIYLSIDISIYPFIYLFIYISIHLSFCPSFCGYHWIYLEKNWELDPFDLSRAPRDPKRKKKKFGA